MPKIRYKIEDIIPLEYINFINKIGLPCWFIEGSLNKYMLKVF